MYDVIEEPGENLPAKVPQISGSPEMMEMWSIAKIYAASGYFQDARQAAQCFVKLSTGKEYGIPANQAMNSIHVIKGKTSLHYSLIGSLIQRSGTYRYRVVQRDPQAAEIRFEEADGQGGWEILGNSRFTKEDAARVQTQNMGKWPATMLFARALSDGARTFCPAIFFGPVYVPEEMGANVGEDGEVIDIPKEDYRVAAKKAPVYVLEEMPQEPPSLAPGSPETQDDDASGHFVTEAQKTAILEAMGDGGKQPNPEGFRVRLWLGGNTANKAKNIDEVLSEDCDELIRKISEIKARKRKAAEAVEVIEEEPPPMEEEEFFPDEVIEQVTLEELQSLEKKLQPDETKRDTMRPGWKKRAGVRGDVAKLNNPDRIEYRAFLIDEMEA